MRTMVNQKGTKFNVIEHIIIKNFWEYYVIDDPNNTEDIKFCLVIGDEIELGDVSMSEIRPYVISRTKQLNEVMPPAANYSWV